MPGPVATDGAGDELQTALKRLQSGSRMSRSELAALVGQLHDALRRDVDVDPGAEAVTDLASDATIVDFQRIGDTPGLTVSPDAPTVDECDADLESPVTADHVRGVQMCLGEVLSRLLRRQCPHDPDRCPLGRAEAVTPIGQALAAREQAPFSGGELVLYPDRVELLGRTILGNTGPGITRKVLEILAQQDADGAYRALGGKALAERVKVDGGQNAIAGCISTLRQRIERELRKAGYRCQPHDVIISGGPGYRFNKWITVTRADT